MERTGMLAQTWLAITSDDRLIGLLRGDLRGRDPVARRLIVAATIDDACSLLDPSHPPRLIVVHWGPAGRYEGLNQLLWATTVLAHRVPVLVVSESYRIAQATQCYRMGVADYISLAQHAGDIGRIFDAYLRPGRIRPPGATARADRRPRPSKARPRPSLAV